MKRRISMLLVLIIACMQVLSAGAQAMTAEEMIAGLLADTSALVESPDFSLVFETPQQRTQAGLVFCEDGEIAELQDSPGAFVFSRDGQNIGVESIAILQALMSEYGLETLLEITPQEIDLVSDLLNEVISGISAEAFSMVESTSYGIPSGAAEYRLEIDASLNRLLEEVDSLAAEALRMHADEIDALLAHHRPIFEVPADQSAAAQVTDPEGADPSAEPEAIPAEPVDVQQAEDVEITAAYLLEQWELLSLSELLGREIPVEIVLESHGDFLQPWTLTASAAELELKLDYSGADFLFSLAHPDLGTLSFDSRDLAVLMELLQDVPQYITPDAFSFAAEWADEAESVGDMLPGAEAAEAAAGACTAAMGGALESSPLRSLHFRFSSKRLLSCLADGMLHSVQKNRSGFAKLIDKYRPWMQLWDEDLARILSPEILMIGLYQFNRDLNRYPNIYLLGMPVDLLDVCWDFDAADAASSGAVLDAEMKLNRWQTKLSLTGNSISAELIEPRRGYRYYINGEYDQYGGSFEFVSPAVLFGGRYEILTLQYAYTGKEEITVWIKDRWDDLDVKLVIGPDSARMEWDYDDYMVYGDASWNQDGMNAKFYDDSETYLIMDAGAYGGQLVIDIRIPEDDMQVKAAYADGSLKASYDNGYRRSELELRFRPWDYLLKLVSDLSTYSASLKQTNGEWTLDLAVPWRSCSLSWKQSEDGLQLNAAVKYDYTNAECEILLQDEALYAACDWNTGYYGSGLLRVQAEWQVGETALFAQLEQGGWHYTLDYTPGRLALNDGFDMIVLEDSAAPDPNLSEMEILLYHLAVGASAGGETPVAEQFHLTTEVEADSYTFTLQQDGQKLAVLNLDFSPDAAQALPEEIQWMSAEELRMMQD